MANTIDPDRKARVISAAWEVFARYGYQKTSIQDIATTAEVSKSVVFKYFQSKENLYRLAFRLAADAIAEADAQAESDDLEQADVFAALRRRVDARIRLFARAPYIYSFSYAAAYDLDPLPRQLVQEEFARRGVTGDSVDRYTGIRRDISPQKAKQMIFWVSQGFLEDRLSRGLTEPDALKKAYLEWVDTLEMLLKERGEEAHD